MTKLFLDDVRMPVDVSHYIMPVHIRPVFREDDWQIVRNYDEFVAWILENGLPIIVSFDHDLEHEHIVGPLDESHLWEKTGYTCAKWMVDFCLHERLELPIWYVHSMNPVGAENIKKYLESFKRSQDGKNQSDAGHQETGSVQGKNEIEQGVQGEEH